MFLDSGFLNTLAVSGGIGLAAAFWLSRSVHGAMTEMRIVPGVTAFWTALVQLCAVIMPTIAGMMALQMAPPGNQGPPAATVVSSACCGVVLAALAAATVVTLGAQEQSPDQLTRNDHHELRQLLLRMREFRAGEIVRTAEGQPAEKAVS